MLPDGVERLSLWESWREAPERARMSGEKHKHSDSIALTKSLLIAARRLFRAGLALSVIASQCHLPYRGEALAYRKVSPLPGDLSSSPEAPLLGELARSA